MITKPWVALSTGYIVLLLFVFVLHIFDFYGQSNFFQWGPPVVILNKEINTWNEFNTLLFLFFIHQMTNTWISEVVYPYIINNIQDSKQKYLKMSRFSSMLLVNLNTIYSILDIVFIVSSVSQISFLLSLVISNMISVSIVNWSYLKEKRDIDLFAV